MFKIHLPTRFDKHTIPHRSASIIRDMFKGSSTRGIKTRAVDLRRDYATSHVTLRGGDAARGVHVRRLGDFTEYICSHSA